MFLDLMLVDQKAADDYATLAPYVFPEVKFTIKELKLFVHEFIDRIEKSIC